MTNINLSQLDQEKRSFYQSRLIDSGTAISLGIVILTLLVFGGVKFYAGTIEKNIAATQQQAQNRLAAIKDDDAKRVADFQNRIDQIKSNLDSKSDSIKILDNVSKSMNPGIYLDSYGYNDADKSVSLSVVCNGFEDMAKQVLNFKKMLGEVDLGGNSRNEDGKINFDLEVVLGK